MHVTFDVDCLQVHGGANGRRACIVGGAKTRTTQKLHIHLLLAPPLPLLFLFLRRVCPNTHTHTHTECNCAIVEYSDWSRRTVQRQEKAGPVKNVDTSLLLVQQSKEEQTTC